MSLSSWFGRRLRRFAADARGSVAIVYGLSAVALFGLIGAAIDYTNAARLRQQVQEALDAAALAGAKLSGRPESEMRDATLAFAQSNMPPMFAGTPLSIDVLNDGTTVRVRPLVPLRMPTSILPIVGIGAIDLAASAEATNDWYDLEIALALDNTGSMNGQKITVLRQAVTNFLNSMETLATSWGRPNAVRVSIVPFDRHVNMGAYGVGQPWIDYSERGGSPAGWQGCVTDRNQPHDVAVTQPALAPFFAVNCNLEPVAALSSDWNALRGTASRMRASGNTNVTIGLVHGWQALTPGSPYPGAQTPRNRLRKVLIALTDGDNTQNRWTTNGNQIDLRTAASCAAAKLGGVEIYTIRVINGDENLLRSCASGAANYYNVTAPAQIDAVFQAIARRLAALRLSS